MLNESNLEETILEFPIRKEIRYTWGNISLYKIILSIGDNSYFSHSTAMILNGLIEKNPETYYINIEQKPKKNQNQTLTQESIDKAFGNNVRISSNMAAFEGKKICILNGKNARSLGVVEMKKENDEIIRVTNIERTLIDIIIRPTYSGRKYGNIRSI